jgi:hypothetical protein
LAAIVWLIRPRGRLRGCSFPWPAARTHGHESQRNGVRWESLRGSCQHPGAREGISVNDMALFELKGKSIRQLHRADFGALGILERQDLQALLRDYIQVVSPDSLVISEEFSAWDRSARRVDLLCVDRSARLVVIELKRTSDSELVDLQALRYAAMVSRMTFDEAAEGLSALPQQTRDGDRSADLAFGISRLARPVRWTIRGRRSYCSRRDGLQPRSHVYSAVA